MIGELFDAFAGEQLKEMGYEQDSEWMKSLPDKLEMIREPGLSIIRFKMEELILYLFAVAGEQKKKTCESVVAPWGRELFKGNAVSNLKAYILCRFAKDKFYLHIMDGGFPDPGCRR